MKKNTLWVVISFFIILAGVTAWLLWKPGTVNRQEEEIVSTTTSKSYPNIVLIIIDALRADKLGCYGFPGEISKEIDAMAKKGVLFEYVLSQSSWTRPSVGSMMTSLYPRSIGIYKERFDILHHKYLTLAEILKANGYQTFGITANPNTNQVFNFHQGFEEYEDSAVVWKWMKPGPGQKFSDDNHQLPKSREIFARVLNKAKSYSKGPVYIQITVMEVHSPYLIRDEYRDAFKNYPVKKVNIKYPEEKLVKLVRGTLGAVQQISYDIGEFVRQLREVPGWENTLFVITSDHGQGLDDHPNVEGSPPHGNLLYESQLRVPLIFYHPKAPKKIFTPKRVKQRVRLLDLMPTILDYVEIPLPKGQRIHGRSLIGLIRGNGKNLQLPDFFVAETNWRKVNKIAVYSQKWKYFQNRDNWKGVNINELQPMGLTENGKLTDKIHEYSEIGKEMKKILFQWEKQYKRAKRTFPQGKLSKKEIEQLKSLGYLN